MLPGWRARTRVVVAAAILVAVTVRAAVLWTQVTAASAALPPPQPTAGRAERVAVLEPAATASADPLASYIDDLKRIVQSPSPDSDRVSELCYQLSRFCEDRGARPLALAEQFVPTPQRALRLVMHPTVYNDLCMFYCLANATASTCGAVRAPVTIHLYSQKHGCFLDDVPLEDKYLRAYQSLHMSDTILTRRMVETMFYTPNALAADLHWIPHFGGARLGPSDVKQADRLAAGLECLASFEPLFQRHHGHDHVAPLTSDYGPCIYGEWYRPPLQKLVSRYMNNVTLMVYNGEQRSACFRPNQDLVLPTIVPFNFLDRSHRFWTSDEPPRPPPPTPATNDTTEAPLPSRFQRLVFFSGQRCWANDPECKWYSRGTRARLLDLYGPSASDRKVLGVGTADPERASRISTVASVPSAGGDGGGLATARKLRWSVEEVETGAPVDVAVSSSNPSSHTAVHEAVIISAKTASSPPADEPASKAPAAPSPNQNDRTDAASSFQHITLKGVNSTANVAPRVVASPPYQSDTSPVALTITPSVQGEQTTAADTVPDDHASQRPTTRPTAAILPTMALAEALDMEPVKIDSSLKHTSAPAALDGPPPEEALRIDPAPATPTSTNPAGHGGRTDDSPATASPALQRPDEHKDAQPGVSTSPPPTATSLAGIQRPADVATPATAEVETMVSTLPMRGDGNDDDTTDSAAMSSSATTPPEATPRVYITSERFKSERFLELIETSEFCLALPGYALWSPRPMEALWGGCIPVIVGEDLVLPFEDLLDWSKFSVRFHVREVDDVVPTLVEISVDQKTRMRSLIAAVRHVFQMPHDFYRYGGDAMDLVVFSLWRRHKLPVLTWPSLTEQQDAA